MKKRSTASSLEGSNRTAQLKQTTQTLHEYEPSVTHQNPNLSGAFEDLALECIRRIEFSLGKKETQSRNEVTNVVSEARQIDASRLGSSEAFAKAVATLDAFYELQTAFLRSDTLGSILEGALKEGDGFVDAFVREVEREAVTSRLTDFLDTDD